MVVCICSSSVLETETGDDEFQIDLVSHQLNSIIDRRESILQAKPPSQ